MQIIDAKGGQWPIDTVCTGCHFGLKLDSPSDLVRDFVFPDSESDNTTKVRYRYVCPLCGEKMEMAESRIPELIRRHIPFSSL